MTPAEREVWLQIQERKLREMYINIRRQWEAVPRKPDGYAGDALVGDQLKFPSGYDSGNNDYPWYLPPRFVTCRLPRYGAEGYRDDLAEFCYREVELPRVPSGTSHWRALYDFDGTTPGGPAQDSWVPSSLARQQSVFRGTFEKEDTSEITVELAMFYSIAEDGSAVCVYERDTSLAVQLLALLTVWPDATDISSNALVYANYDHDPDNPPYSFPFTEYLPVIADRESDDETSYHYGGSACWYLSRRPFYVSDGAFLSTQPTKRNIQLTPHD